MMAELKIGGKVINEQSDAFVVAECGHNHQGDLRKALEMAQRGLALNGSHPELRRYAELASKGLSEQER